ncbi:unnamed protein product [Clonostachys rhizophaga]|uniref:Uncharacterized protein n=1 Tax=Clonostachys rhizophaga TaxID=160324 RepID=A0A9N9VEH6_9HYPO|nr:unnamed protein product [Clonostachys rhizophaga]
MHARNHVVVNDPLHNNSQELVIIRPVAVITRPRLTFICKVGAPEVMEQQLELATVLASSTVIAQSRLPALLHLTPRPTAIWRTHLGSAGSEPVKASFSIKFVGDLAWLVRDTVNDEVKAKNLINHWVTYLSTHNWTLHTNYLPGEFEKVPGEKDPGDTTAPPYRYKNIRSYENGKEGGPSRYLGPESFLLLPCELYSLKHCAESLSVRNNIAPWINASFPIGFNISYHILPPVVAAARDGLRYVLDHLEFEKQYRIELIPGWEKGDLKGKLSLSIPESKKAAILDAFEKSVYEMRDPLFRDPTSIGSRGSPLYPNAIRNRVPFFPDDLRVLPLNEILQDLLAQVMPWFQDDLLFEYLAFQLTFDPRITNKLGLVVLSGASVPGLYFGWKDGTAPTEAPDASLAGYIFWSMLMELETKPILNCLLRPLAASHYGALKAAQNPNGLWAAVCEDRAAIDTALQNFLNLGAPSFDSKPYAWKSLIRNTILSAIDEFKKTGKYYVMVTDAAGAVVQDLMDTSVVFICNIWKAGEQTLSTLHKLAGQVEQWWWIPGQGGLQRGDKSHDVGPIKTRLLYCV